MNLEIITTKTVHFDAVQEREHIMTAFRPGARQTWLLDVLNQFERVEFKQLANEAPTWKREWLENLNMTIYEVIKMHCVKQPGTTILECRWQATEPENLFHL